MTADERMRETMAASQALARCFLSQDKVICSSSFFMYNPSLIFFSISNLFNNWYSFLYALASLDFKLSVSGSPFLQQAHHLRVFQSYFQTFPYCPAVTFLFSA